MIDELKRDAEIRMKKSVDSLATGMSRVRTGRAQPGFLEPVQVSYYGSPAPLKQVAAVGVSDARTLVVTPFDKAMVGAVEKAIIDSNLGLNPVTAGTVIRVPLPPLTEERRRDLARMVRQEAESARVAVRNIRRDVLSDLKSLMKDKEITEDEERRAGDTMQKITDRYIAEVDTLLTAKEKELMEI